MQAGGQGEQNLVEDILPETMTSVFVSISFLLELAMQQGSLLN